MPPLSRWRRGQLGTVYHRQELSEQFAGGLRVARAETGHDQL